jgi:hypothetical protein
MPVRSGRLLRPLLAVRRSETRACCAATALPWREDPTNAADGPLRNRVRHHLLPLLEQLRPGATRTLARTATLAADERTWLDPLVATALTATTSPSAPPETGAGRRGGAVDSGEQHSPPWATLPVGAPHSQGGGATRPELPEARSPALVGGDAYPQSPVDLDADGLADLPVGLARRVVRAAAVRAGVGRPDAAATDRVLALTRAGDGAGTAWPGGMAVRDGPAIRLRPPAD